MQKNLLKTPGFFPYILVVLLNAMLDLGHKIIIQNTIFKCYDGSTQIALTAVVNACILLPYILFFTPAGFLSDRFAKSTVIRATALGVIPLTICIFFCYRAGWFAGAFAMTLLLAAQSAFYSPAKYGYIKEMVGSENLSMANGVVQAITIIAILAGGVLASVGFEILIGTAQTKNDIIRAIAPFGLLLIAGAILQFFIALRIPEYKAGEKTLSLNRDAYLRGKYLRANVQKLHQTPTIWYAVLGLSAFWGINQVVLATFGAHLKDLAGVTSTIIAQGLLAMGGVGIMLGAITAGKLSKKGIECGFIPLGALGMTIGMFAIPLLQNTVPLGVTITFYGFFGGLLLVPLNALIQFHAKEDELGTILAGNNFLQNICMLAFLCFTALSSTLGTSSIPIFFTLVLIAALGTGTALRAFFRETLSLLVRFCMKYRYQIHVAGTQHIPGTGGVLLLGNHTSWIDWAVLYLACPRPVRFVMTRTYYDLWYLRWFFKLYNTIPLSATASGNSIKAISKALENGECVAMFPEGALSRNGQLGIFHRGYTLATRRASSCVIVPFYVHGLWGSFWSAAGSHFQRVSAPEKRAVHVRFGAQLPKSTDVQALKNAVQELSVATWQDFGKNEGPLARRMLQVTKHLFFRVAVADDQGNAMSYGKLLNSALLLAQEIRRTQSSSVAIALPQCAQACIAVLGALLAGKNLLLLSAKASSEEILNALQNHNITVLISAQKKLNAEDFSGLTCIELPLRSQKNTKIRNTVLALCPTLLLQRICVAPQPAQGVHISFATPSKTRCLHEQELLCHARQLTSLFPPKADDVLLNLDSPENPLGFLSNILLPLLEGLPTLCADKGQPAKLSRLAAEHQITMLLTKKETLSALVATPQIPAQTLRSLHTILCLSSHVHETLPEPVLRRFGQAIYRGYAPENVFGLLTINAKDVLKKKEFFLQEGSRAGTFGLPLPGIALRILDDHQTILPAHTYGNLCVAAAHQPKPLPQQKTSDSILDWQEIPEKGTLDEDGFLLRVRTAKAVQAADKE